MPDCPAPSDSLPVRNSPARQARMYTCGASPETFPRDPTFCPTQTITLAHTTMFYALLSTLNRRRMWEPQGSKTDRCLRAALPAHNTTFTAPSTHPQPRAYREYGHRTLRCSWGPAAGPVVACSGSRFCKGKCPSIGAEKQLHSEGCFQHARVPAP